MSNELPEGWASARLRDGVVAGAQTGFACGKHSRDARGVAHLRPMNVSEAGRLRLDDVKFIDSAEVDRDERWIRSGDVLFNNTNSPELVGKTAVYTEDVPRAFSNHMTRVRCTAAADPQFLAHAIHQKWREGLFASICNNHVSQASISTDVLLDLELPVPPLAEQRRIVAKVEALLEQVRRAKDRLDRVPVILKRFRQAVLAAACAGQLTEEWRDLAHVEPAEKGSSAEPSYSSDREVPDLPDCWRWHSLRSLVGAKQVFCYGVVQPGHDDPDGVPLIRAGDLHDLTSALPNLRRIPADIDDTFRRSRVVGGEVLVTVVGANIGTVALAPRAAAGFNIARAVAKVPVSGAMPEFVLLWLRTTTAYRWMVSDAREVARPTLNLEQLGDIPVPVPPLDEQAEIVRRVDGLFALATSIEQRVERAAARARSMPQAILSKAFAGDLVPTEAELARAEGRDYETAAELLRQLTSERRHPSGGRPQERRQTARDHESMVSAAKIRQGHPLEMPSPPKRPPTLDEEVAMSVLALLHAADGTIARADLARAFVLRSHPDLLRDLAPTSLPQVHEWAARVSVRPLPPGKLVAILRLLEERGALAFSIDDASQSVVTIGPATTPKEKIHAWFTYEANLALLVLRTVSQQRLRSIHKRLAGEDRSLVELAS